jgi:methionine aminotransferase
MNIESKLPHVGTTIFTVMSQLATEHKAINLGQGFPDYSMNDELIELVNAAMKNGMNQYTHMAGYPLLRERLAEKVENLYNNKINPDTQITITPGATYAIYTALTTILQPGDEVIVFEPAYDSYIPNIEINPTGSVLSEFDLLELQKIVSENPNIIILSDEVYEHLIFDGIQHESVLKYPELLKRSFVCFSFGKTYHCTGWKLGYCISSPDLMKEFRKVHQFNAFCCITPTQVALADYLQNSNAYLTLPSFMQEKRDYFQHLMLQTKFKPLKSNGSYFQCYSYAAISDESDKDFAIRLVKEYSVATIPVSAFYKNGKDDHVIRFCFAKKEDTLQQAVDRLKTI